MPVSRADHLKKVLASWWDNRDGGTFESSYILELVDAAIQEAYEKGRSKPHPHIHKCEEFFYEPSTERHHCVDCGKPAS